MSKRKAISLDSVVKKRKQYCALLNCAVLDVVTGYLSKTDLVMMGKACKDLYARWLRTGSVHWRVALELSKPKKQLITQLRRVFAYQWNVLTRDAFPNVTAMQMMGGVDAHLLPSKLKTLLLFAGATTLKLDLHNAETIRYLELPYDVDVKSLPPNLATLHAFNPNLLCLPASLTELHCKNLPSTGAAGWLPSNLRVLKCGSRYNLPFKPGILPESLTWLDCGMDFNATFTPGSLPSNLKTLMCGNAFNSTFEPGSLPLSLKILNTGCSYQRNFQKNVLPHGLLELTHGGEAYYLPTTLTHLHQFNAKWIDLLPSALVHFTSDGKFVDTFVVSKHPEVFDDRYTKSLPPLPSSLTILNFNEFFRQRIPVGMLPASLTQLMCGEKYTARFEVGALPVSLLYLHCGYQYNVFFEQHVLPQNLVVLYVGMHYTWRFEHLPDSLRALYCNLSLLKGKHTISSKVTLENAADNHGCFRVHFKRIE
jgi:hypothetical protein